MKKHFEEEWRRKWFDIMVNLHNMFPNPWFWRILSNHANTTMEFIFANPDYLWNWEYVSNNVNLTLDIVLANPEKQWNWKNLTSNSSITHLQMNAHPHLPWERWEIQIDSKTYGAYTPKRPRTKISPFMSEISPLESLQTLQPMMKQPDKNWNYERIAYDNNLPLIFVANHMKKFKCNVYTIHQNEFTTDKQYYVQHYMKWMRIMSIYEMHMENTNDIDCSNLSHIEYILFDEFLVLNLLKF